MADESNTADDWQNAADMIRAAGYFHPAEVIEEQAATIERLLAVIRDAKAEFVSGNDFALGVILGRANVANE